MGMFNSIRNAIASTFDVITDVADAAGETVGIATTYIDNRAAVFTEEDMATVATASAKRQAELKRQLEDDEDAAAIYTDLVKKMEARKQARLERRL